MGLKKMGDKKKSHLSDRRRLNTRALRALLAPWCLFIQTDSEGVAGLGVGCGELVGTVNDSTPISTK